MLQINSVDRLTEKEEDFITLEHETYETAKGAVCNYTPFHFIENDGEAILGIISGYTCWEEVYIDDLIVCGEHRNSGIGRALIETVEHHFSGKGFHNINLVTSAFQAPGFYKKCGYELEFVRKNEDNPKLDKYFFVKLY